MGRWVFQAKPAPGAEGGGLQQPRLPRRKCSPPWRTPEGLCRFHHDYGRKPERQAEAGPRRVVPFPAFCDPNLTPPIDFVRYPRTFGAKQTTEITGVNRISTTIYRNSTAGARFRPSPLILSASALPVFQVNGGLKIGKHLPKVTNILHFSLTLHSFVA